MVYGYEKYTLSNETSVEVGQDAKGRTYFRSGSKGEGGDNPSDPMKLSTWQQRRAVEYEFVNKSSFLVETRAAHRAPAPRAFRAPCTTQAARAVCVLQVETFFSAGPGLGGNLIFGGPTNLVPGCEEAAGTPTRRPQAAMSARAARALDGDESDWESVAALVRRWM